MKQDETYWNLRITCPSGRRVCNLVFCLFLFPFSALAFQNTTINFLVPDTILIASEPNYPPYGIVDKNGHADGFSVEIFKAAARAAGLEVKTKVGIWSQIKGDLAAGRIDALPLVGRTPEREHLTQKIFTTNTFDEAFNRLEHGMHDAVIMQRITGIHLLEQIKKTLLLILLPVGIILVSLWIVFLHRQVKKRTEKFQQEVQKHKKTLSELAELKSEPGGRVARRTEELEEKVARLDTTQKAMLYMVEDLNNITAELKNERKKLELSNRELEAFTYSVSHDLKAPLRAISGYSNFLIEDYSEKLDDEGKRFLNTIRENASRMDHLISDMLNLSRVSRASLNISKVNMHDLVKAIYNETVSETEKAQFVFHLDEIPNALCDQNLMKQVWQNLISNALKYSSKSPEKEIEIGAETNEDEIIYYIKDKGAGFDPKYADKIFGVFQRLHNTTEYEGTGVGLAIVQRIIFSHGGKTRAKGETGKGAAFYFSLPAGKSVH